MAFAVASHEAGIVVDFEEVPDTSQAHYREFAAELGPALHAAGLKLFSAMTSFTKRCQDIRYTSA